MSYAIMDIKGIGPLMADKLKKVGIRTTAKLLETAKSAKGRKELAIKIGLILAVAGPLLRIFGSLVGIGGGSLRRRGGSRSCQIRECRG